ncbi:MAG: outer membrane lipoprotein carrier protein LolA [Bacteroidia bacterium]|jgi:outer membrane lipoprotein-sorting protein|nr:outer membrane lipoprotein carrier protein LolA [Bacteroidota bacterium]MBP6511843.1 outer membrane lipoprotein carrier protein LolA [Bacteroidia bacterium]
MNKSKLLSACLAFTLLLSTTVFAQSDAKSSEILKSVSAKYKSYKSLSASFKLSRVDQKTKASENFSGTIVLNGPKFQFVLNNQTVMSDGASTWTFLKESNEVQISESKSVEGAISPTNIFTMYEKGFKTKYIGDKKEKSGTVQQIELTPDDTKKNYFKILLSIDKAGQFVKEAKIYEKSGAILTYSIVKFTPNSPVNDNMFVFDTKKYPGVEVIDLR